MKNLFKLFSIIILIITSNSNSFAAEKVEYLKTDWSFKGLFGKFDRASLQRGYQVYNEVCASCHSLKHLSYRNLSEKGGPEFSEEEAKAIAPPDPPSPMITEIVGTCNAIQHSMDFAIASPIGYGLDDESLDLAKGRSANTNSLLSAGVEPLSAVKSADIVYTDVWTSMGDESESDIRRELFSGYTVDEELLREAKPDAIFMHDMPAHYGEEVVAGMLEHPQSVAYIQANNRLHCQKAILEFILQR